MLNDRLREMGENRFSFTLVNSKRASGKLSNVEGIECIYYIRMTGFINHKRIHGWRCSRCWTPLDLFVFAGSLPVVAANNLCPIIFLSSLCERDVFPLLILNSSLIQNIYPSSSLSFLTDSTSEGKVTIATRQQVLRKSLKREAYLIEVKQKVLEEERWQSSWQMTKNKRPVANYFQNK